MKVEFLILNYRPKKFVDGADIAVAYRQPSHEAKVHCRMATNWSKSVIKGDRSFIEKILDQLQGEDIGLRFETWERLAESDQSALVTRERGMCDEKDIPALLVPTPK